MKLTRTEQLFLSAHRYNWDAGTGALKKILADPECDLGTALLIYWRGRPEYYRQWASDDEVDDARDALEVVRLAERKILAGGYARVIRYDPSEEVGLYKDLPVARALPEIVYQPSEGEISAEDLFAGRRGEGAFLTAAKEGRVDLLRAMLDDGIDVNVKDRGVTALGTAAAHGQVEAVELLLAAGADPKIKRSDDGDSAVHHAVSWPEYGHGERSLQILERLFAAGIKVDHAAKWKKTPLHLAAAVGRADVAAFLVARGARRDLRYLDGRTALHCAARGGHVEVLRVLLDAGWDLHAVDDKGLNALHHAVDFPGWNRFDFVDRTPIVALLLERGCDREHRAKDGMTVAERAREHRNLGPKEQGGIAALLQITAASADPT